MSAATETGEPTAMTTAAVAARVRPFYWSVVRELWEHRSLYLASLIAAGVMLFGVLLNTSHFTHGIQTLEALDPPRQRAVIFGLFSGIWILLAFTMAIVTAFYALDALYAERRDRSMLFWKSMPVSDVTTVLAKLFTALVVSPVVVFVIIVVTQLLILLIASAVAVANDLSPAVVWSNLELGQLLVVLLYTLLALMLWYAPVYAWLLLVSSWAKRSPFLWAVLPPVALVFFEKVAFGTGYFARLLQYRLQEGLESAFDHRTRHVGMVRDGEMMMGGGFPDHVLQLLSPGEFFSNPWLWVGLAAAGVFTAGAIWMRRYREPI